MSIKWTCFFRHWRHIVIETWYPGDEGEYWCMKCAPPAKSREEAVEAVKGVSDGNRD
jgi:hypothetical protein